MKAQPTERAKLKCKNWLVDCLNNGWSAGSLTRLEALWWEYHDYISGDVLPAPRSESPSEWGSK